MDQTMEDFHNVISQLMQEIVKRDEIIGSLTLRDLQNVNGVSKKRYSSSNNKSDKENFLSELDKELDKKNILLQKSENKNR